MADIQIKSDGTDGTADLDPADVDDIGSQIKDTLAEAGVSVDSVTVQRDGVRVAESDAAPPLGYLTNYTTETPENWLELPEDHTDSTCGHFHGGFTHQEHPLEILVWTLPPEIYGITADGEVRLEYEIEDEDELVALREGYRMPDEPVDKIAREIPYNVELVDTTQDGVLDSIRADDGWEAAHRMMQELEAGEYDDLNFGGDV